MRGGWSIVVSAPPYEEVECRSVRWSCCLFVRCVVGDDHPPHPLFLVGRLRRTIAVPTLSSMRYPNAEALPKQISLPDPLKDPIGRIL